MVNKNEIIDIEIIDIGENGEGIGKLDGYTIFVHGGVPGDTVKAKIIKVKKQYAVGIVKELLVESSIRQEPECAVADKCGGCQIQQIKYDEQIVIKKQIVKSAMKRIGGFDDLSVNDVMTTEPIGYRNKSQYPIRRNGKDIEIGFYKQRTHDVVDIDACPIQHELINRIMFSLKNFLNEENISIYNEEKNTGYLKHIVTRISFKTEDVMIIYVTHGKDKKTFNQLKEISKELNKEYPEIKSFINNVNPQRGNRVMGYENNTILGEDKIFDYIQDLKFEISPLSFLQVNPKQTEVLYSKALDMIGIDKEDIVFDIFCGIGTISLFLAKYAKKVYGVEIVDVAIEDAKENAINNNIDNTEFIAGKAEVVIPELYNKGINADVVVLDPPRKGCDKVLLDTLLEMEPKEICYISCKASTLARDLKILSEKYDVVEVQPVDLFPNTMHVETIVKLVKK